MSHRRAAKVARRKRRQRHRCEPRYIRLTPPGPPTPDSLIVGDAQTTAQCEAEGHDLSEWIEPPDAKRIKRGRHCLRDGCDHMEVDFL